MEIDSRFQVVVWPLGNSDWSSRRTPCRGRPGKGIFFSAKNSRRHKGGAQNFAPDRQDRLARTKKIGAKFLAKFFCLRPRTERSPAVLQVAEMNPQQPASTRHISQEPAAHERPGCRAACPGRRLRHRRFQYDAQPGSTPFRKMESGGRRQLAIAESGTSRLFKPDHVLPRAKSIDKRRSSSWSAFQLPIDP